MTVEMDAIGQMTIRPAGASDLSGIVNVHRSGFPGFLMTLLGPGFLRAYYQCVLEYENSIALLGVDGSGKIHGFVVGFVKPSGFYNVLKGRRWRLAKAAFMHMIFRPVLWPRVLHDIRDMGVRSSDTEDYKVAELASIAVVKNTSNKGLGAAMVQRFIQAAREAGARRVVLTTDAERNERVNNFYARQGFRLARTLLRAKSRPMNEYVYELGRET